MRVTSYETIGPVTRERWNTNTVARIDEVDSFSELLTAVDSLRGKYAPARLLCSLDGVGQCQYTSIHASFDDRLGYEEHEFEEDDFTAAHHADNAHIDRIAAVLDDPDLRVEWEALAGTRNGDGAETDVKALVEVNRQPDRAVDEVVVVQRVPVSRDDLALVGIPNGYFEGDWDTFQNHAMARRMAIHGYRHIGTGASLLGFDRPTAPTSEQAQAVVADLASLYGAPDSSAWSELATTLCGQRILLIGYTEDFADTLDI
ncbi:hypothetical protein ABZ412_13100 [Nocardia sp. NPDC005746]|uniref:hypothetical protein n=1 Tax=Nocardia sp. NPDC005746 TaxID=3157062 RepID=UPI0033CAFC84